MKRAGIFLTACLGTGIAAAPAIAAEAPCLHPSRIVSYNTLDNKTLIVRAIGGKRYRLELAGGCIGLDDVIALGVTQHGVGICVQKGDSISYRYHGFGEQQCLITSVSAYTPKPETPEGEDNE
jgi:hypothetical protein